LSLVFKCKVGKKGALYLPKGVLKMLRLREGVKVELTVEEGRLVVRPIYDPLDLALNGPKFAETTVEEFERESEEMQSELFED